MSKEMTFPQQFTERVKTYLNSATYWFVIALGSIFLALMSQLSIPLPFSPVPITLQTFAISLLAMSLGSKKAPLAVAVFLAQATIGFPVLAGGISNPFWMLGMRAGYLIGFAIAAYLTAHLLEKFKPRSFFKSWIILSTTELSVLLMGCIWLSFFIGGHNAIMLGLIPFIPGAIIKISTSTAIYKLKINMFK